MNIKQFWRWIKKSVVLHVFVAAITVLSMFLFGLTLNSFSFSSIEIWITNNMLLTVFLFLIIHLIIEGMLIEKVNQWIK